MRRLQAQHKCSAMPWVNCTAVRYQCTRQPDISLCPEAFADGLFPTGTSARDFVRLDASSEQRVRYGGAPPVPLAWEAACAGVTWDHTVPLPWPLQRAPGSRLPTC